MNRPPFLRRILQALVRDRGDRRWDAFLRSTGVLGVAGIALVLVAPASASLVGLAIYGSSLLSGFRAGLPFRSGWSRFSRR